MIFESTIQDVIQRTPSVKSFCVACDQEISFKAGQFMEVTILVDGAEQKKYLTISSSPTQKGFIEFSKRITGSPFSLALDQIKSGDWVKISMPFGVFTLDKAGDKIAFLSGGIGITPIHSICQYAADQGIEKDIVLLYGNRSQEDIPFKEHFQQMQNMNEHFHVVHILEQPPEGWQGHTGYITKDVLVQEIPDYAERTFFVCGPPAMVDILVGILKADLQLPAKQIVIEKFAGY